MPARCYPNRFAADLLTAMVEVMGEYGLNETLALRSISRPSDSSLDRAYPYEKLAALNDSLDAMYGERGGRGMALRSGRSWFAGGMKEFGALRGIANPAFRVLSVSKRCRIALNAQAEIFTHFSDQPTRIEEVDNTFRVIVDHSPFAEGLEADRPVCHILVGLLQECMRWASNGRDYVVRETQCVASGGANCIFVIQK